MVFFQILIIKDQYVTFTKLTIITIKLKQIYDYALKIDFFNRLKFKII